MKITSDGTAKNTHVFTDSGEEISRQISDVSVNINSGGIAVATITFIGVKVDMKAVYVKITNENIFSFLKRLLHVKSSR